MKSLLITSLLQNIKSNKAIAYVTIKNKNLHI